MNEEMIYCALCEIDHENNSSCQMPNEDDAIIHYEDRRGV